MNQKKKILFLTRLYHPHIGGVEKHVEEITRVLAGRGYKITILTEQFDKRVPVYEKKGVVEIFRIPVPKSSFFKKYYIWKWMLKNWKFLKKHDIIHIHDVFYWILPIKIIFPSTNFFITYHGYEGYPVKKRWILLRKLGEKLSEGTICVGDFMKKWYKASPNSVIYGGVRLENQNINENKYSAVFFGRLDDQTGFLTYLEAYKILKRKFPKFHLTVVGEGEFEGKIPKDVEYHPFTHDITPYIAKSRFIFVSRYLSMLEALSLNKEVIAVYDNPIKRDYLTMSPFSKFINVEKNAQEIAKVTAEILEKKSKTHLSLASKWAREQSWENIVNKYVKLWSK